MVLVRNAAEAESAVPVEDLEQDKNIFGEKVVKW